jgi:hypothetical protein
LPTVSGSESFAELDGDWSVTLGEKQVTSPLKSWEELGVSAFAGTGIYRREFTAPGILPTGKRYYLDLGNVHEIARVRLNGTELPMRPWPPYLWDVTPSIKSGVNMLEVGVRIAAAGEPRGAFSGGNPGGRRGAAGAPGPEAAASAGFAPTGVPGGLSAEVTGGRGRGMPGAAAGFSPGGMGRGGPATPTAESGLLGPVRVLM